MTFFSFSRLLVPAEKRGPFFFFFFFFFGGGGGACDLKMLVPLYENPRPHPPPVPLHWKNPSSATGNIAAEYALQWRV